MPIWAGVLVILACFLCFSLAIVMLFSSDGESSLVSYVFAITIFGLVASYLCWVGFSMVEDPITSHGLSVLAVLINWFSVAILFGGAAWLFRPLSVQARLVAVGFVIAHFAAVLLMVATGERIEPAGSALPNLAAMLLQVCAFAWWSAESAIYFGKVRQQVELGLARGLVASRFAMISIATGTAAFTFWLVALSAVVMGQLPREIPWLLAIFIVLGSVAIGATILALAQPRFAHARLARLGGEALAGPSIVSQPRR